MKKTLTSLFAPAGVCLALSLGASPAAAVTITPDAGPTAGGTRLQIGPVGVTFTAVSAGSLSAYALGDDGNVYAWGDNEYGQLGTGDTVNAHTPVKVMLPAGVKFTALSAGSLSAYALGDDGHAYAWGDNEYGQLGTGDTVNAHTPVKVMLPAGVKFTALSSGGPSAYAVGNDGKTYAWGFNGYGQLGTDTTADAHVPVAVAVPAGVSFTAVSAGVSSAYALGDDRKTYAWGDNEYGQLGRGDTANAHAPVAVTVSAGETFVSVSGGAGSVYARGQNGDTYAWGDNDYGQLGRGDTANAHTPIEVAAGVEVTGVLFGSLPGTAVSSQGGKTWTVTSPAHRSGTVSLSVSYTQFGERKSLPAGSFTFGKAPVITENPASQTVSSGDSLTLTAAADGDETPTVRWQSQTSDGNWADIPDATATQYKTDPIRASQSYRAVFANALGSATTTPAIITIATPTPTPTPISPPVPLAVTTTGDLAATGSEIGLLAPLTALLLLAGIAVCHAARPTETFDESAPCRSAGFPGDQPTGLSARRSRAAGVASRS
ncbi:hypothetical protein ATY41_04645 [Leifsonia xyli subsp. xyli]|uniref:Ig-like domain-containing protein n=1 Tax=Leifsonia xyli subsp. xyli TaxID=59736 RepID=A0A1E2SIV1_LEIXY|nr:hypothetical protein [Leifsonia xyli]ODA89568.1 hypothetical protein ATY41_04645 [Leifsonia xyli subsp. xyli]